MSDSRLEKFIYAICSMDVSDLPVPLSRIEKLWNCLITGETPDFEPLSRNEKYLMAMLDRYDLNNLPAPVSRGEKLLYKIAIGETDLSDVPGYLSRYEELLKYLIENGGIGDFEYVLYTLNQSLNTLYTTAEKPVKSAILKGQTLVNLAKVRSKQVSNAVGEVNIPIKPNAKYIAFSDVTYNDDSNLAMFLVSSVYVEDESTLNADDLYDVTVFGNKGKEIVWNQTGAKYVTFTSDTNHCYLHIRTGGWTSNLKYNNMQVFEYQDGMENWDIPYFEGMQSVKMPVLTTTGNNLFDGTVVGNYYVGAAGELVSDSDCYATDYIKIESDTNYCINTPEDEITGFYDKDKNFISSIQNKTFLSPSNARFLRTTIKPLSLLDTFQLEDGTTTTPYEPYKSNILNTSEDVVLRGVGDVQDTLDCLTGEVVQNIGEMVLDGSEDWFNPTTRDNLITFRLKKSFLTNAAQDIIPNDIICDKLPLTSPLKAWANNGYIPNSPMEISRGINKDDGIDIIVDMDRMTEITNLVSFKQWLNNNHLTVQYQLAEKPIKTVDLTVVDQDNQPTQLGTFENVTHVSLESAGLIPEVEMEVATRISKELASASPLMDDISTKQEQLNTMVDEQSNNVDATMIATTEIYEGTL